MSGMVELGVKLYGKSRREQGVNKLEWFSLELLPTDFVLKTTCLKAPTRIYQLLLVLAQIKDKYIISGIVMLCGYLDNPSYYGQIAETT